MSYHFYFPEEFIELQKEISYHPDCILKIMDAADYVKQNPFTLEKSFSGDWLNDFCIKLSAVCTYLNILVDGDYDERQLRDLATICTNRLRDQRKEWRVDHGE